MNAELAREIISQALSDEVWETDVPEDDAKAIADASEIVEMSQDAWDQNVKGPEVEAILKLAARAGATLDTSVAEPQQTASAADDDAVEPTEPWDDYKSDSVAEVLEAIEIWQDEGDTEQLSNLIAYEEMHKNRVKIIKAAAEALPADEDEDEAEIEVADDQPTEEIEVETPEAEDEDEEELEAQDEDEVESDEPFEGYNSLSVAEVKEALEDYLADEDTEQDDKVDTLAMILEFEQENGERKSLINYLNKHLEAFAPADDEEEPEVVDAEAAQEEAGEAEDSTEPEADQGTEEGDQGGEGDSQQAEPAAEERVSSAGTGTLSEEDGEAGYDTLIEVVRQNLKAERLHVPERITESEVALPFDLTKVSDNELQKLYSAFMAYSYRAAYLLMEHEAISHGCRVAADEVVTAYIAEHGTEGETMTVVKAEAEQIEAVKVWRKRQRRNDVLADAERRQRDAYDKVCERLSRIGTLRQEEWTRSSSSAVKSKRSN